MGLSGAGHSFFTSIVMMLCFLSPVIVIVMLTLMKFFNYLTGGAFARSNSKKHSKLEYESAIIKRDFKKSEEQIKELKKKLKVEHSVLEYLKEKSSGTLAKKLTQKGA